MLDCFFAPTAGNQADLPTRDQNATPQETHHEALIVLLRLGHSRLASGAHACRRIR